MPRLLRGYWSLVSHTIGRRDAWVVNTTCFQAPCASALAPTTVNSDGRWQMRSANKAAWHALKT
jgi:hypothetical protein